MAGMTLGEFPYRDRVEIAMSTGTTDQQLEKLRVMVASVATQALGGPVAAELAELVEREVMFDRPGRDPRTEAT